MATWNQGYLVLLTPASFNLEINPDCPNTVQQECNDNNTDLNKEIQTFISRLGSQERMLVILQHELYEDSWVAMLTDLKNRLEGKPFIFKLANRIKDDIDRIAKLQNFEEKHSIKLSDFINQD